MIVGDSYSTHKDHIPEGNTHYYCTEGRSEEEPNTKMRPEETWWGRLIEKTDAKLILNDSWSGSTIGYTGYSGDCSNTSSFICRYDKHLASGFFSGNRVDTIFVFGGTNDGWCNAPLGEEKYSDWKRDDLFSVLPAICYLMSSLKKNHPDTRIVFIQNTSLKPEIIECMKNASARLGVELVELDNIDKVESHPTVLGMGQICEQVLAKLEGTK